MAMVKKIKKKIIIGFGCGILLCIFAFNTDNEIFEKMTPYLLSFSTEDISCYAEPSTLRESKTPNIEGKLIMGINNFTTYKLSIILHSFFL